VQSHRHMLRTHYVEPFQHIPHNRCIRKYISAPPMTQVEGLCRTIHSLVSAQALYVLPVSKHGININLSNVSRPNMSVTRGSFLSLVMKGTNVHFGPLLHLGEAHGPYCGLLYQTKTNIDLYQRFTCSLLRICGAQKRTSNFSYFDLITVT
jgi:hypothetical protein